MFRRTRGLVRFARRSSARLLLANSVSWKFAAVGLRSLALKQLAKSKVASSRRRRFLQAGLPSLASTASWGMAGTVGASAYLVDRKAINPWMFFTEALAYGALGTRFSAWARKAHTTELTKEQRDAIALQQWAIQRSSRRFLSAAAFVAGAGFWLRRTRRKPESIWHRFW